MRFLAIITIRGFRRRQLKPPNPNARALLRDVVPDAADVEPRQVRNGPRFVQNTGILKLHVRHPLTPCQARSIARCATRAKRLRLRPDAFLVVCAPGNGQASTTLAALSWPVRPLFTNIHAHHSASVRSPT